MSGPRWEAVARPLALLLITCLAAACGAGATPTPSASPSVAPSASAAPSTSPLPSPSALPSQAAASSSPSSGIVLAMADVARAEIAADDLANAAASVNGFGVDLLRRLASPGQNLVFSPTSIVTALAMARAGARGQTATEMDDVLHAASLDELLGAMNALDLALAGRSGWFLDPMATPEGTKREVLLQSVSAPFAQAGYPLEDAYLEALAADFGAGLRQVDYRNDPEGARNLINDWVAARTADRIKELLAQGNVTPATRLVLVNAIYLKAPWQTPFDPDNTKTASFTRADGTKVQVPMMHLTSAATASSFLAAEGDGWVAVQLPYLGSAQGDGLAMTIVVPDDLTALEAKLDAATIGQLTASDPTGALATRQVDLSMPRFSFDTSAQLADQLKALGMPTAFDPAVADFSGIADPARTGEGPLSISEVIHQANISVDEKGTEAAAATAVVMGATAGPVTPPPPLVVRADHPFLYLITDQASGAVLFMGQVGDPSA
jgi:serpin B